MAGKENILEVIYKAVDKINETQPHDEKLEKSVDTILFGGGSKLDSLAFINFIVEVEQRISEKFDSVISLANDTAIAQTNSPFRSLGSLADYINSLLKGQGNG
jgi:acyl carrier protein